LPVVANIRRASGCEIVRGECADADVVAVMIVRELGQDSDSKFRRELIHPSGYQVIAVLKVRVVREIFPHLCSGEIAAKASAQSNADRKVRLPLRTINVLIKLHQFACQVASRQHKRLVPAGVDLNSIVGHIVDAG